MARLAESMAEDQSIGDAEILIAIDHLNEAVRAAESVGGTAAPDTRWVKRILEEVASQRNILIR